MYGRGGAGNINAAKESSKRVIEDIEAAQTPSASPNAAPPTSPSTASQDYSHMGRGGAGNWYQPSELQKEGTFTQPSDATALPTTSKPQISTPWHPEGQQLPVARSGRGGAGNFVWGSEERARREREEMEEEERRKVVREGVERDVEIGLAKPKGVVLGREGERDRGW